jgi:hypothetical protein
MNDLWNTQLRVAERQAEMIREAQLARSARVFVRPSPWLTTRLAVVLRGAADLLDARPADTERTIAIALRNSGRGSAGA